MPLSELQLLVQVDEVKNIMVDNIERVLERGEKIELLVDKTDNLRFQVGDRTVLSGVTESCRAALPAQPAAECRRLRSWLLVDTNENLRCQVRGRAVSAGGRRAACPE